jgi:ferredoxin-NADP reductase
MSLKPGQEVIFSEPIGDFVLPKDKTIPLVFLSGGIGVAPVRSIVKWLVDNKEQRPITLNYFVKTRDDLAFQDLFESYEMKYIPITTRDPDFSINKGPLDMETFDKDSLFYVSGPQKMVEDLVDSISEKYERQQIVMDYFPGYKSI